MKRKRAKKLIIVAVLLLCCLLIHWYSADKSRVETGYSTAFFPGIAAVLRTIFGFFPFSIGDILYGIAAVFLLIKVFQFFRFLFSRERRKNAGAKTISVIISAFTACCVIYLVFNLLWGINYNRKGIAFQLGLEIKEYSTEDLKMINALLVEKINRSKSSLVDQQVAYPDNKALFKKVEEAYQNVSEKYPFLQYNHPSLKSSMWGWFGNYTGFTGYYNPFTAEAQVNTTVPKFTQPFTACHEAAHSLGYAKEMEANFTSYLAAAASDDTLFHYSVYSDLFLYANRSLYFSDTAAASVYRKMIIPAAIADFKERSKFNREHTSFMEPITRMMYGKYLESNQQPEGILAYDEVTAFLIAYYKKFGTI